MKQNRKAISLILPCLFGGVLTLFFNGEVCMAKQIDAALNVMGYDRDVTVTINGVRITKITGGQSQSVRLFLADDPRIKTFPPEMQKTMKERFCLRQGENTIEISFRVKAQSQAPIPITITIEAENYKAPVLKYVKNPDVREGSAKGAFTLFADEPAGFKTVVLE